ncbi:hypothetical protein NF867_03985 [Solitalea sp. MAHUQ-68]|uniref:DUF4234 domain-containing protein n=1 Tax=Solitalea agri TaxID=2953739 RepID=A0A9X2F469_9SPHI|nr:hypothetical protein [Solitalea agri]MCO4292021.1 hypothetical protein [Solitalea agri]
MEEHVLLNSESSDKRELVTKNQFIILNFLTFNLYSVWWMYKSWNFFKEKESSDIMPAMRALFSLFFLYGLFEKIKAFAKGNGYSKDYSSGLLFIGLIVLGICAYLPEPFMLLTFISFICFTPAVEALNFGITESNDGEEQTSYNTRQIVLLVLGSILWVLVLMGLFAA